MKWLYTGTLTTTVRFEDGRSVVVAPHTEFDASIGAVKHLVQSGVCVLTRVQGREPEPEPERVEPGEFKAAVPVPVVEEQPVVEPEIEPEPEPAAEPDPEPKLAVSVEDQEPEDMQDRPFVSEPDVDSGSGVVASEQDVGVSSHTKRRRRKFQSK